MTIERVKGAKDGDFCDEYKNYYGKSHPVYGGKLTDLYSLPVGTIIDVTTGDYSAIISVNSHGDKGVETDKGFVKLTKEHHSAYIK